ncbi:Phosphatidylethanolamine-binding protein [Sulfitobacter sp. THAF37]|uniref:YbhB/YbcL family Raf kinase inhibitor-like protein n=1 Tax=Sulfitobacter sp. THAF37 TaxID=2587855 RepID=UPI0012693728|nr:YbhB/YbcL family Raf kinase inhibitor-like protein [Sulfitobacter sp. THAF37]QFT59322.1 Phosphatidylethanolamine-binding protein [Sulfitobacter sp. THAF37]
MRTALLAGACLLTAGPALAFDIGFDWSGLKSCTNGRPNTVANPAFTLSGVPAGTKFIRFKLTDRDVPNYNHGGGVVAFNDQQVIPRGAFKYKSPCPPSGSHTYEWTATAQTKKNGGKLATTRAARKYP